MPVSLSAAADDRNVLKKGDTTVLIIEDDAMFASVLMELAREKGFKGLIAQDGASALALAHRYKPDAITLDIKLPDMDGWALLDLFKHDPRTRHVPIHVISVDDQRKRGLRAGAFGFLEKPVDRDALFVALERTRDFIDRPVKSLLLVEDDANQRASIAALIGNGDVHVTSVATAQEALDLMRTERFDCAVIDLGLPDRPGAELIEEIRRSEGGRDLPVVVYTGQDLSRDQEDRLTRLASTIIVKDADSPDKLLGETALFLHRAIGAGKGEGKSDGKGVVKSEAAPARVEQAAGGGHEETSLKGRRVLVVDDDMRNIFSLTSALEQHGMLVVFAENGREGIERLRENPDIDIMLCDIMMPEMDGYETMRAIRADGSWGDLPIVAVTAKAMKGDREKCLDAGASDYIAKPVDLDQLLAVLRVQLGQAAREARADRMVPA